MQVNHDSYIKDKDAFVFSLNNNKIYKILIPEHALRFHEDCPILIGNNKNSNGFFIYKGKVDDSGLLENPKIYDFQKNNELTEGSMEFKEFEVFEINYN